MKHIKNLFTVLLIALTFMGITAIGVCAQDSVEVYRVFSKVTGEHLYTPNHDEVTELVGTQQWLTEGAAWYSPTSGEGVYRLYNPASNDHLYTTDTNEVETLTTQQGWTTDCDGQPIFYSGGDTDIYRLFTTTDGHHFLTTDLNEYNTLATQAWQQEDVAFTCEAQAEAFPNSEQVYQDIISMMNVYPEGTPWSTGNYYRSEALDEDGIQCHSFALLLSDAGFGSLPGRKHHDTSNIRVGDLLRIRSRTADHSVIVLGVDGDTVTVAEGNWDAKVHWGRQLSISGTKIYYIQTRYPE